MKDSTIELISNLNSHDLSILQFTVHKLMKLMMSLYHVQYLFT